MKRLMCILLAAAMSIGASAQGQQIVRVAEGVTISTKHAMQAVNKQMRKVNILRQKPVIDLELKEMIDLSLSNPLRRCYSFAVDTNVVEFSFYPDSIADCKNPDSSFSRLKELPVYKEAKENERAYIGKTFIGDGVYVFDSTFTTLRFYRASQTTPLPLLYFRK